MNTDILLVNGSPAQRRATHQILEHAGYAVREVISLDQAVEVARTKPPLAVVLEAPERVDLPQRFVHRLRHHPMTREVPILMLTADDFDDLEQDDAVSVTCVPEPCSPRRLLEELAYLTRPRSLPPALRGGSHEVESGEAPQHDLFRTPPPDREANFA